MSMTTLADMQSDKSVSTTNVLRGSRKRKSVTPRRNGDIYTSSVNKQNISSLSIFDEDSDEFDVSSEIRDIVCSSEFDESVRCKEERDDIFVVEHNTGGESNDSDVEYKIHNMQTPRRLLLEGKVYKCEVCGLDFQKIGSLIRHETVHAGEMPFKCDICHAGFVHVHHLQEHVKIHLGEKPYNCDVCGVGFTHSSYLIRHMRIHIGEKPIRCDDSCDTFACSDYVEHKPNTAGKPYKCDICGIKFTQDEQLCKHIAEHVGDETYKCESGFTHSKYTQENRKRDSDKKPYCCKVCGMCFIQRGHLYKHTRLHSDKKPFSCGQCGMIFTYNNQLQKHIRMHTGEKPFKCDMCDKRFTQSGHLYRHRRKHTEEKTFNCSTCDLTFAHKCRLEKHMRKHSGEKRFKCEVCGKAFPYNSSLHKHRRMHTGEKPYKCNYCGKVFPYNSSLHKHKKIHAEKKVADS